METIRILLNEWRELLTNVYAVLLIWLPLYCASWWFLPIPLIVFFHLALGVLWSNIGDDEYATKK